MRGAARWGGSCACPPAASTAASAGAAAAGPTAPAPSHTPAHGLSTRTHTSEYLRSLGKRGREGRKMGRECCGLSRTLSEGSPCVLVCMLTPARRMTLQTTQLQQRCRPPMSLQDLWWSSNLHPQAPPHALLQGWRARAMPAHPSGVCVCRKACPAHRTGQAVLSQGTHASERAKAPARPPASHPSCGGPPAYRTPPSTP